MFPLSPGRSTRSKTAPPSQAVLQILGWAADNGALVIPAHVAGTGGVELTRDGTKFAIKQWAPFDRI
jgi:hypothetical protein